MTTTEPRPALKSLTPTPDQPRPAEPAGTTSGRGAPKVAARQGVPSAGRPDPQHSNGPRVIGWLHIQLPTSWRKVPRAVSHCDCGRHVTARGHDAVVALIAAHAEHRALCTLHTAPERRQAA